MRINSLIVISDLHCGCQVGLCPAKGIRRDEGGRYQPSSIQSKVWGFWEHFWKTWVPDVTRGEPWSLALNGDSMDGRHHNAVSQISQNLALQQSIAYEVLAPRVEAAVKSGGAFYMIRGTEAHVGPSGEMEESLAHKLGAKRNKFHQYSRYFLDIYVGSWLVNIMHHIGTTGTSHYESTAVMKELIEAYVEASRWRSRPPDAIVRSHRHRCLHISFPTDRGSALSVTTPGWQAKTPFVYKIPGGRQAPPQFGGICIKAGVEGPYLRYKVWSIGRPRPEGS